MVDGTGSSATSPAQQILQEQAQRGERAEQDARTREARPDRAAAAQPGVKPEAGEGHVPEGAVAARVAAIAALRDEALAATGEATRNQLAAQARGETVPVGRPTGETPARAPQTDTSGAAIELERQQAEATTLARQVRDGSAGAPHGGGAKADSIAIRVLLGN